MKIQFILLLLLPLSIFAQTDSSTQVLFCDLVVDANYLYGLHKNGTFTVWETTSLNKVYTSTSSPKKVFLSIAKDTSNTIFLGTTKGEIFKLNTKDFSTKLFLKLKKDYPIEKLVFNKKNEVFAIGHYGIYDPIKNKRWYKFKNESTGMVVTKRSFLGFRRVLKRYFVLPTCLFLDSQNILWMTKRYGEFGASLQRFDAQRKKIVTAPIKNLRIGLLSPRAVFEDDYSNIYIASGTQHFSNQGKIYKIDTNHQASVIHSSKETHPVPIIDDGIATISGNDDPYIGPCQYNEQDQHLYISTTRGFYKVPLDQEGKTNDLKFLFQTTLKYDDNPLVLYMNKLAFTTDNKMVLLTYYSGIAVYDQQTKVFKLLK